MTGKPGLHAERLSRIHRIIQTVRDVYLPFDAKLNLSMEARAALTTVLKELEPIIKELTP